MKASFPCTTFSLKSLPYTEVSNKLCISLPNTYFYLFIYVVHREAGNTCRFFFYILWPFGLWYYLRFLYPEKGGKAGVGLSKQAISTRYITVRTLNTTKNLTVKHVKNFQDSLCDDSCYEKNDENAFGINDKYSCKTKVNFGKYSSIYATKTQFFSNPINKFGFGIC
jgi:hypothetical protein